jgi:hypothetical protein
MGRVDRNRSFPLRLYHYAELVHSEYDEDTLCRARGVREIFSPLGLPRVVVSGGLAAETQDERWGRILFFHT